MVDCVKHTVLACCLQAVGPLSGKCEGVSFQMEATQLSASNLDSCGINGAEYNVLWPDEYSMLNNCYSLITSSFFFT